MDYNRILKIIENSQTVVFCWRAEANWPVVYASRGIEQFGYTPEDFVSGRLLFTEIIHEDDLDRLMGEVEVYTRKGVDSFGQRYRIYNAKGMVRWIDDRTVIERDQNGEPEFYLGTITDITAQIEAEDARRQKHAFTQKILDHLQHPVMVIGADYHVQFMNQAVQEMMVPDLVADLSQPKCYEVAHQRSTPCDGVSHPCPLKDVMRQKQEIQVMHKHRGADGEDRFVELNANPLFDKQGEVTAIIESAHDISELVHTQESLCEQANALTFKATHDELTGLPNRRLFMDSLDLSIARAERYNRQVAMVFIDVDKFKLINDQFGHEVGDKVLKEVAHRIKSSLRHMDMVGRIGGDEFTLFFEEFNGVDQVKVVLDKIMQRFIEPIATKKQRVPITLSAGISLYPHDATERKKLMHCADVALYDVKAKGRNHYQFYRDLESQQDLF